MIAYVTCTHPECSEEIEVSFDYEPADTRAHYPEQCAVTSVEGCDCEQDDDMLQESLFTCFKSFFYPI